VEEPSKCLKMAWFRLKWPMPIAAHWLKRLNRR